MLALPIISFATQITFLIIVNAINMSGEIVPYGFSIFTIIVFVVCLLLSIISIVKNAKELRWANSKARYVTGLVFSIVGTFMASIFVITLIVTAALI